MLTFLRRGLSLVFILSIILWPITPSWSAPASSPVISNIGRLSLGGTVVASSTTAGLYPEQAFDGVFFGTSKGIYYENGWVARTGSGAWLERQWPGSVEINGLTITRRSDRTIGLCSKAREIAVDLGSGQPKIITLADTNAPQYFPLTKNSTRSLRLTVQSVEGIGCTTGAAGFSEIEIFGLPKSWTPNTLTTAVTVLPSATIPANQLQFTYDTSIPLDSQAYLTELTTALLPVMTEALGPPLTAQTLLLRLNPAYGSFTYAPGLGTITMSRLPNATWPINDISNWDFNANLIHELAHAYQAGYGATAPAWFREGFAQSAAELVKQIFIERGNQLSQNLTIDEGQAIRTYDVIAAMGPEALTAAWDGNSRIIPYTNATGLWWLLMLSQTSPRPTGAFSEIDYLRRVETGLLQYNPDISFAGRRNFLASLSPNPIDGLPVSQWLMRQSIVQDGSYENALGFYPSDCLCSQAVATEAQHLFIFARGEFGTTGSIPIQVTLRDSAGLIRSDQTVTYTDYGFGYFYYTWPIMIDQLPAGRYDITIDAVVNGAPLRATQSFARGTYSQSQAGGLSVTRRLATLQNPLTITSGFGTYQPTSGLTGRVMNLPNQPFDLSLTVNNRPTAERIFWPAPYTRFINLP